MNNSTAHLSARAAFTRILRVGLLVAILGGIAGALTVRAETKNSLYVDGYGNVLTAVTTGFWDISTNPDTLVAVGGSTTTTAVYYLKADTRIWHWNGFQYVIAAEDSGDCNNCSSASTDQVASLVFDARAATQSHARASWNWGNSYYTSFPDNSVSCCTYWSSGNSC
ncbi:MAG: hypothetical protein HZB51_14845 [Chloroflexi bacterium]|nr:hypothetical protein [Chloroflexota bacterium]